MDWFENDELFFNECKEGYKWEDHVAAYFRTAGMDVVVPRRSFEGNPSVADYDDWQEWSKARGGIKNMLRVEHANAEDLLIENLIFEIKSRKLWFTSPKDFRYDTIIVDTVKGFDAKVKPPVGIIYVSRYSGNMMWLSTRTKEHWTKRAIWDRTRQINEENYECPKSFWRPIESLVATLRKMKQSIPT